MSARARETLALLVHSWNVLRSTAKATAREYVADRVDLMAAGIAFYGLLSLAPLLLLLLTVVGWFVGERAASAGVVDQVQRNLGPNAAAVVQRLTRESSLWQPSAGMGGFSAAVVIYASTRLFWQLQEALNHVWRIRLRPAKQLRNRAWRIFKRRAQAFVLVVGASFLLVSMVLASTGLTSAVRFISTVLPFPSALPVVDACGSVALGTLLFAAAFKVLPDAKIEWRHVWLGALITAVLFTFGKALLTWYLAFRALPLQDGFAAPLLVLLLWAQYSAQVFLVGAEVTEVWARNHGKEITPSDYAEHDQ